MAFTLGLYPWVYKARYNGESWDEEFVEKEAMRYEEEHALSEEDRAAVLGKRNSFPELPLVNYTTQYALGCFEGLKAFPQKGGGMKIFRPGQNAIRMKNSMEGLMMPSMKPEQLKAAIMEILVKNKAKGYTLDYDTTWEKDNFSNGSAIYIRPFAYAEPGIGINLSFNPWIVIVCTPVSAYFVTESHAAVTSKMVRATPNGTGWIKCASNYVVSTLAKKRAQKEGYMEAVFLDSEKHEYIEEGSSCNFFALLEDNTIVTPSLGDTVLPGITRNSIIQLAKDAGYTVEERPLSIHEVLEKGKECFVSGTAVGVNYFGSLTHEGKTKEFGDGKSMGPVATQLRQTLKGIQYGALEDKYGWMDEI